MLDWAHSRGLRRLLEVFSISKLTCHEAAAFDVRVATDAKRPRDAVRCSDGCCSAEGVT